MVKVLAICAESPDNVYGGMGVHCRNLYQAMTGADVTYLTLINNYKQNGKRYQLRHPTVPTYGKTRPGRESMQEHARALLVEGMKCEFDVIHAHDWSTIQPAFDIREVTGKPVVTTFHLFQHQIMEVEGLPPTPEILLSVVMEGNGIYQSDGLIVCSQQMQEYIRREMGIERTATIIPNAVNLGEFDVEPAKIETDKPVVLFCGRLSKQKGIEQLLDAIEQTDDYMFVVLAGLATKEPNPQHIYDTRLRELEQKYPERLRWVGHIEGPERFRWHKRADVGLMPSLCEPFGIVALEFFAAGTPLVTTAVDGMRDFVNDDNAFIMPGPDAETIVKNLNWACGTDYLGRVRKALATAREHTWEEIAARTVHEYHCVLDTHVGPLKLREFCHAE